MSAPAFAAVEIGAASIVTATWGSGPPRIVLLHDGLGSIAQWRTVPSEVARRTGQSVLAYDRPGHGASTPVPSGPWPADWLSTEADRLAELLEYVGAESPLLVGHSDGGTIALLHATRSTVVRSVLALAAHSWVEDVAADFISGLRRSSGPVIAGLARYHDAPSAVFEAWSGAWTSDEFASWDIRPALAAIGVPVVIAQGTRDEYATDRQAVETAAAIGDNATCRLLPEVKHLMHHDTPDIVIDLICEAAR